MSMAKAAFGPRLNGFGSWEEDSHSVGWTGANNWVAGAELQFDLFSGGAKRAQLAREKALQERAAAGHAGFQDAVRLEVRQAYYQFDAAQQQVKVARSAIAQADESLRINQNRYESGLSTVTDMLRVEEAAHRAKADYWQAVYRMNASYAGVELATGTLTTRFSGGDAMMRRNSACSNDICRSQMGWSLSRIRVGGIGGCGVGGLQ